MRGGGRSRRRPRRRSRSRGAGSERAYKARRTRGFDRKAARTRAPLQWPGLSYSSVRRRRGRSERGVASKDGARRGRSILEDDLRSGGRASRCSRSRVGHDEAVGVDSDEPVAFGVVAVAATDGAGGSEAAGVVGESLTKNVLPSSAGSGVEMACGGAGVVVGVISSGTV
jgi:hypothetical protein